MMKNKTIAILSVGIALTLAVTGVLIAFLVGTGGDGNYLPSYLLGDPTADPDYDVDTLAPTANEKGFLSLGIWEDGIGAFRTCRRNEEAPDHWRVAFAEDNTMMLWAMSKGTYKYSHHQGYPAALRDFILSCIKSELEGTFYMGLYSGQSDSRFVHTIDRPDGLPFVFQDPYVQFMPLWGVVTYTMAYPKQEGKYPAEYYANYVSILLEKQQQLVDANIMQKYLSTSSLAFHMASVANWYLFTHDAKYLEYAKRTYAMLKTRINQDGSIKENTAGEINPLRHIQTVWGMFETIRAVGDFDGMRAEMERTRAYMKPSEKYGKGIYLYNDTRGSATDDSNCTQLQIAYGYYYLSAESAASAQAKHGYSVTEENAENLFDEAEPGTVYDVWVTSEEEGLYHSGTVEGNSMAWLVDWWRQVLAGGDAA